MQRICRIIKLIYRTFKKRGEFSGGDSTTAIRPLTSLTHLSILISTGS